MTLAAVPAFLWAAATAASAQETDELPFLPYLEAASDPGVEEEALPASLALNPQDGKGPGWALGIRAGYLRSRDADEGTWFGGVQVRIYLLEWLGIEGSIEFHQNDFLDGDVTVTQYPVQATGLLFIPVGDFALKPYGLAGAGWYYTRTDYSGTLSTFDTETDSVFGIHLGGGGEIRFSDSRFSINADVRYVFLDEPGVDNSQLEDEESDYWQATAAFNIRF